MIPRIIHDQIGKALNRKNKILVLFGPRQVGKTTLVRRIVNDLSFKAIEINADQYKFNEVFSSRDLTKMQEVIGGNKLLFIDEAQKIEDIGINLKILFDNMPDLRIIATGSSSFELANNIREPLTGRTRTFQLFPISIGELMKQQTPFEIKDKLHHYLIYGMYPEIIETNDLTDKRVYLEELTTSYLFKDILQLTNIRYPDKLRKLLRLLAFQVGSLVSVHELAKSLELSHEAVNNYIDLLEKTFVIFRLSAYSRNLRKEITKMDKIYFYDLGVRNILIENLNPVQLRQDVGALWENFLIMERRKKLAYDNAFASTYFWRTYSGAELDYVEESNGELYGYEFKFKSKKRKPPKSWIKDYNQASFEQIHSENFLPFVV